MPWKISEWIMDDMDEQGLEAYQPDEEALGRVMQLAREKAELPAAKRGVRRLRPALRLLIAAIVLLAGLATALARTDLGAAVANAFSGNEEMTQRLAVLGLYGDAIGQMRTDQGIDVTVEAAYADETGFILLFRLDDPLGRLTEQSALRIDWKTDIGGASWSTKVQRDEQTGQLYAMLNLLSGNDMRGKKFDFAITQIDAEDAYIENHPTGLHLNSVDLPAPIDGLPMNMPEASLTQLRFRDGTAVLAVETFQPDGALDVQQSLEFISLRSPGGEIVHPEASSLARYSDPEDGRITATAYFPGFENMEDLEGYTLCINYRQISGSIEGEWSFQFRLPKDDAVTTHRPEAAFAVEGEAFLLERVRVGRTSVVVEYRNINAQAREERDAMEAPVPVGEYDDWWFEERDEPQPPSPVLVDAQGQEIASFSLIDQSAEGAYRTVFNCGIGEEQEVYLCFRQRGSEEDLLKFRIQ